MTMTERPQRNHSVEINVVVSGHKRLAHQAVTALQGAGFTIAETRRDDWGLPSYTDPFTAHDAGHPNSGHTPGTTHPDRWRHLVTEGDDEGQTEWRDHDCGHVGSEYARDDRIAFVGVTISVPEGSEAMRECADLAHQKVESLGWTLRLHWETPPVAPLLSLVDRLKAAGIDIVELRQLMKVDD